MIIDEGHVKCMRTMKLDDGGRGEIGMHKAFGDLFSMAKVKREKSEV